MLFYIKISMGYAKINFKAKDKKMTVKRWSVNNSQKIDSTFK